MLSPRLLGCPIHPGWSGRLRESGPESPIHGNLRSSFVAQANIISHSGSMRLKRFKVEICCKLSR